MARLNLIVESDDEFPDVSILLGGPAGKKDRLSGAQTKNAGKVTQLRTTARANPEFRRQRPLKLAHVNSLLLPIANEIRQERDFFPNESSRNQTSEPPRRRSPFETQSENKGKKAPDDIRKRSSPRKAAQISSAHSQIQSQSNSDLPMDEDNSSEENMSDFIVSQSDSDLEAPPVRSPRRKKMEGFARESKSQSLATASDDSVIELFSPRANVSHNRRSETPPPGPSHESFDEDCLGRLRL